MSSLRSKRFACSIGRVALLLNRSRKTQTSADCSKRRSCRRKKDNFILVFHNCRRFCFFLFGSRKISLFIGLVIQIVPNSFDVIQHFTFSDSENLSKYHRQFFSKMFNFKRRSFPFGVKYTFTTRRSISSRTLKQTIALHSVNNSCEAVVQI